MVSQRHLFAGTLLLANSIFSLAAPTLAAIQKRAFSGQPDLRLDFPDPAVFQDADGTWYSFATNSNGKHVQAAKAPFAEGPWTWLDVELLPDGEWTTGFNTWAPDIRRVEDGSYVMYYSGEHPQGAGRHCVGVATASTILGPYAAKPTPFACPLEQGGAIDPSGFLDTASGRRYVTYKVDGNAVGNGGDCNNGVEPLVSTPLVLQEVAADGVTTVGDPVQILDRAAEDGPLVEAPSIVRAADGRYVLFYSSHCFTSPNYDVKYAFADSVAGPYVRSGRSLLRSGDFGLVSPGGATSVDAGNKIVFHADYTIRGDVIAIN
jgi:hypothetical protein